VLIALQGEDATALQILWQWDAQMGVIEHAQIIGFGRIDGIDLAGFDGQLCLAKSSSLYECTDWQNY